MKRLLIFQIITILILGLLIFAAFSDNLDNPRRFLNPVQAFEETKVEEIVTRTPLPTIYPHPNRNQSPPGVADSNNRCYADATTPDGNSITHQPAGAKLEGLAIITCICK